MDQLVERVEVDDAVRRDRRARDLVGSGGDGGGHCRVLERRRDDSSATSEAAEHGQVVGLGAAAGEDDAVCSDTERSCRLLARSVQPGLRRAAFGMGLGGIPEALP